MSLRLPSRGMRVAPGGAAGFRRVRATAVQVPSGVMPNSTSRRKKRFPPPPLEVSSALRRLPQVGAERGPETVDAASPARGVDRQGLAPDTYIDAETARIVHFLFRLSRRLPADERDCPNPERHEAADRAHRRQEQLAADPC